MGLRPKDFDIATSARPQQMKKVFPRNCRIIGRRFKLAHPHFNSNTKILEAATFRRTPEGINEGAGEDSQDEEDLLIVRDNEFGTAEEDAVRRDFTVNALFLDPLDDRIIDYVGGLADVRARLIRTIGDPEVRFREDPVRILRAAKFAGRLGFTIDAPTYAAMKVTAPDLTRSAPPRLLEEILRLLRGGHALDSLQILRDVQALQVILPAVGDYLGAAEADERVLFWRTLESLDNRIARGDVPSNPVLLGALFNRPMLALTQEPSHRSPTTIAEELIGPFAAELRLPRRDAGCLKRICGVQTRFTSTGRRRFRMASFLRDAYFPEALELFELTCRASGEGIEQLDRWRQLHTEAVAADADAEAPEPARPQDSAQAQDSARSTSDGQASGGRDRQPRRRRRKNASAREPAKGPRPADTGSADQGAGKATSERPTRRKTAKKAAKTTSKKTSKTASKKDAAGGAEEGGGKRKRRSRKRVAAAGSGSARDESADKNKRQRGRGGGKQDEVKTLEPEHVDLSAFDIELDPKRVPTFTSIVEGKGHDKKKRPRLPKDDDDTYKSPPPPGTQPDDTPPPPPADDDVFGDW